MEPRVDVVIADGLMARQGVREHPYLGVVFEYGECRVDGDPLWARNGEDFFASRGIYIEGGPGWGVNRQCP